MTKKFPFAAAMIVAGLMFTSGPSIANTSLSVVGLKAVATAQGPAVQKVGYWNRCRWGIGGYHKWVPGVGRVQCTARKCWRNSWGIRRCRWY